MATLNDKLSDEVIAHMLFVNRYSAGVANRMIKLLNQGDAELSAKLMVALDELDPNSFTVKRLESMLVDVREVNRIATQRMFDGLQVDLRDFSQHEAGYQLDLFNAVLPVEVLERFPLAGISFEQVYAAAMARPFQGRLLKDWAKNLEDDRLKRITNAVSQGYLQGETVQEIVKRVRGARANNFLDSALNVSRANAASIVKTAINHTASVARNKFAEKNSDIIKAKQWSSTLDTKTSAQCRIRDRLMYSLENKPLGHKIPYLQGPGRIHWNCRSGEIFITKSWKELGFKKGELSGATRASMDGQLPAETSYGEWLQRQSAYRQTQVLGPVRYQLIKDGGMSYDSFYSDKGEWLTLEQLRELDARAFEEAGL
ncbi:phage minor head protein [Hafnia paralvei]|uniref:phage minor head protein n=1 Tax=Hafnia paralvei TaxID=546367 RepID=UPI0024A948DD|nr:phage minor head protein [Hafnia paralvei]